jgi:energy-coupling factor transporter ATP-binding protein EcfA2
MSRVVCLVGEPGAGKSTLFDAALGHLDRAEVDHLAAGGPMRELLWDGNQLAGCELGRRLGKHPEGYPGTDTMSMTAIVGVDEWLRAGADGMPFVFLEGTRLANARLVKAALAGGHTFTLLYLHGPAAAEQHRAARGSNQNPQWLKGRQTAAKNFYELARREAAKDNPGVAVLVLHAKRPVEVNVEYLRAMVGLATPVS